MMLGSSLELNAGLFGKKNFGLFRDEKSDDLRFIEEGSGIKVSLGSAWNLELPSAISGPTWLGTTYREEPYSEVEFNQLREERINKELERLKAEHIKRAKLEKSRGGGEAAVDDLLSDLLSEGEKKKEEDVTKYLVDFDEEAVRRKIASRTFVPQTRYVPIPAVYLTLKNQQLFCIDLKTGITSWVYKLALPISEVPFETEANLYIVQAGACYIIDKQTGLATQKINFDRAVYPIVYAQQDRVYPVGYGNRLASWSPQRNTAHWYYKLPGGVNGGVYGHSEGLMLSLSSGELLCLSFEGEEKWSFVSKSHSDEKIYLEKLIADVNKQIELERKDARQKDRQENTAEINKFEKEIERIELKLDQLEQRTRGKYVVRPHVFQDSLIIGSTDFNLYRLNRFSGLPEWSYSCSAAIKQEAFGNGGWVFVRDDQGKLHKVNYSSGVGSVLATGVARVLETLDSVSCYEKNSKIWMDWGEDKGYFEGWDARNMKVSKDFKQMIGLDLGAGLIKVWKIEGIRQLPRG